MAPKSKTYTPNTLITHSHTQMWPNESSDDDDDDDISQCYNIIIKFILDIKIGAL